MKKLLLIPDTKLLIILHTCVVFFVFQTIKGVVWAQSPTLKFKHLTVDEGLSQNTIHAIVKDKYGYMWFGTWEGVNIFDGYTVKVHRASEKDTLSLPNNRVNNMCLDSFQNIWISTGNIEYCRYNYETENFSRFPGTKVPDYILQKLGKRTDNLHVLNSLYSWEIKGSVLLQTNNKTSEQIKYTKNAFDHTSLSDQNLNTLFLDNSGILWVGTENGGVNYADTYMQPLSYYFHSPVDNSLLVDNVIRSICEDAKENIWIGTLNKGISVYNPKNQQYQVIQTSNSSLISNEIRSLLHDRDGNIWIGTKNGLSRYNVTSRKFYNYNTSGAHFIPHNWVFHVMEDQSGDIWIATFRGIAKYNVLTDSFIAFDPTRLFNSRKTRLLLEDNFHNLWVATEEGGITVLGKNSGNGTREHISVKKQFLHSVTDTNSLVNNTVLAMARDKNGIIWVGTNNGINKIDPKSFKIERVEIFGFPDRLIMGMVCDSLGYLWISHKKGLTRLNPNNLKFRNFTKADGLQGNEFTQNACFKSLTSNLIYFGGINGLNVLNPLLIQQNPHKPQVKITSLYINNNSVSVNQTVNDRKLLTQSLLGATEIEFKYFENSLSFGFNAFHYTNAAENKYAFKLEGWDSNWVSPQSGERIAHYSNLAPGTYVFKVKAANCDGIWCSEPASLKITIRSPWWKQIILPVLVLMVLAIPFLIFMYKRKWKEQIKSFTSNSQEPSDIAVNTVPVVDPLISSIKEIIIENISDTGFNSDLLCNKLNLSQRQLYRKLKVLTNQTVHDFITDVRMDVARDLLISGKFTISEIAYKVGFTEPANFTRTFTRKFGKSPSVYIKNLKNVQ